MLQSASLSSALPEQVQVFAPLSLLSYTCVQNKWPSDRCQSKSRLNHSTWNMPLKPGLAIHWSCQSPMDVLHIHTHTHTHTQTATRIYNSKLLNSTSNHCENITTTVTTTTQHNNNLSLKSSTWSLTLKTKPRCIFHCCTCWIVSSSSG